MGVLLLLMAFPALAQDVLIEKSTNGQDADLPPGPAVVAGSTVNWSYLISAGIRDLQNVVVTDDQGVAVSCPSTTLGAGTSMTCTASALATVGQYANIGTVNAEFVVNGQPVAPDTDPSHYFGVAELVLSIEKSTEGFDADTAPGPTLPVGSTVNWTYLVTNEGTVDTLTNVVVTDDQGVAVSCPDTELDPAEFMTCTGSGTVQSGQYANIGAATADLPGPVLVVANDPSHYVGQSLIVEKATNGQDADTPPGPSIPVGGPVAWTYLVGNPGPETISNIVVTDDQGVVVTCPQASLAAGANMVCTGNGVAAAGPYANIGTATGQLASGPVIVGTDPSHYSGILPNAVDIEKSTNGQDADLPPGPIIQTGTAVAWTYLVSNFGAAQLTNIVVTDDQGVTVTCPGTTLNPTESMTCTAAGTAIIGTYENLGTVDALLSGTGPVTDSDLSHYFGQDEDIDWGDAPDPTFPTSFVSAGASHLLSPTVFLGACVDSEIDGQPSTGADGDDLGAGLVTNGTCAVADDDEDGVTFLDPLVAGAVANIEVVANAACTLTAWIDFNVDGDWGEASDDLFPGGVALVPGLNPLSFTVPIDAFGGTTFARFRCTTDSPPEGGVFGVFGQADDGEVEDYAVEIELDLEATLVDSPGTAAVPGDLISYEATVTSVAGSAADVNFDLTLDPNTLPSGVVTTTPLARDDGLYEADPSVPTTVDGTGQPLLLANDFGIPAPTAIAAVAQPTTLGGSVDINTDGSFTYTPPGGAIGGELDSFTYDLENGIPPGSPVVDTATASLILGGPPVAADDDADDAPAYFVTAGDTLTIIDGPSDPVDRNDFLGSPAGALSHFGGGDLGGAVTDNLAGATVAPLPGFVDGSLTVNADGSFTFVTPATQLPPALSDRARGNGGGPGLSGPWQFEYRLTNASGTSDATVTIEVQLPPDAIDDGPAPNATPGDPFATLPDVPIDSNAHATPSVLTNDILGVPAAVVTFYGTSAAPMTTPSEGGPTPTDQGGTVEVSTDGNFLYTPPGGFAGTDAFGYVLGNPAGSDSAVVTILVAGPPLAQNDALTVVQNTSTLLDSAPDNGSGADDFGNPTGAVDFYGPVGGPLTTTPGNPLALASGNTVTFTGGAGVGTFTYDATVNPTFSGNESFDYQLTNVAGSDSATVSMTVQAPPTAVDDFPSMLSVPGDAYHTAINTTLDSSAHATPPVLGNDDLGFPLGALVSYGTSGSPTDQTVPGPPTATDNGGTVVVSADGNFVYTPPSPTFTGPDQFAYRLLNVAGFDDGTVTIAVGLRPVCDDETDPDDYDALGNVGITVPMASGVLVGDTGDGISVTGNTAPASGGTATVAADGSFTYVSGVGFNGDDMFTYTVGNGFGDSAACTVEVVVANTLWFIDNQAAGGGNGTLAAPFDALSDLGPAADDPGDIIFLDEGDGSSTNYDTGIVLKDDQVFIGQGVDLATGAGITPPPFSDSLPGVAGRPTMSNTTGAGIVLASGNVVRGLDVTSVGAGIAGTNSAGATVSEVVLSATGSDGVVFSNATGTIDFDNLDVTNSSTIGINISGGSASYDFDSASSITNPAGIAFRINGGTASVTYSGSISQANNAALVSIANHATGTVTFQTGTLSATNGNGIQLSNADGAAYSFSGTVTLNGGDAGIDILSGSSGTFTFASTTITNPSGTGLNIDGSTAAVTFSGGSGISKNNAGAAVNVNSHSGGAVNIGVNINATNGTGLRFSNADATYNVNLMTGATTLNGGDAGIDILSGSAGTFTFGNTTITTPTNGAFNIDSSSATVNYNAGSITQSSAATAYRANGNSGGTQNIGVAITANTSTATGISLTNNTGATFNFTGALDIDTTSGGGFIATGGGTVSNDSSDTNTIVTTTGTGINIEDTTIGAGGVTFRSISSNGAATTIDIDTTGTTGSFDVTGAATDVEGGDASGGTIQSPTADGITIAGSANFSIKNVLIDTPVQEGIHIGRDVVPPAASTRSTWTGTGRFDNITVRNVDVANTSALRMINGSGTSNLTVDRSIFTDADTGQAMFLVEGFGTTNTTVTVEDSSFTALQPTAYQHQAGLGAGDTPTVTTVLSRNSFINAKAPIGSSEVNLLKAHGGTSRCVVEDNVFDSVGLFGVVNGILNVGGNSNFAAGVGEVLCRIEGNDFSDLPGKTRAINVKLEPATGTAGLVDVTIDNNRFDDLLNVLNDATAIYVEMENAVPTSNIRILNNNIGQGLISGSVPGDVGGTRDGIFIQVDDDGAKTMNLLMEDNLVRVTNTGTTVGGAVSGDQLVQINADDTGNRINATIHGNTFDNDGTGDVVLRSDESPAGAICLDLNAGNVGADSNSGNEPIVLVRDSGTTFETEGTSGTDATVETFLNARNGATVDAQGDGGGGFTNSACPMPPAPPVLP